MRSSNGPWSLVLGHWSFSDAVRFRAASAAVAPRHATATNLRYIETRVRDDAKLHNETVTVRLRYKEPDGRKSRAIERTATDGGGAFADASGDARFASAVAEFGMILRDSSLRGKASIEHVIEAASNAKGTDTTGYRAEFVQLAEEYKTLASQISREK